MAIALCVNAACSGLHNYSGSPSPLQERSWIAPGLDRRDSLLFEAQIATNIFLLDELLENERALRSLDTPPKTQANRFFVTPLFRIRQLRDSSAAVRTPSFSPSLFFERHWLSATERQRRVGDTKRNIATIRDLGLRGGWTHHSNGQAGCFFAGYVSDRTGNPDNCTPGPNADTTGIGLNRASGDFSTTFWSTTGFARRIAVDLNNEEDWVIEAALGYQLHRFGIFGDMRQEQRNLYGSHRGRLDVSARKRFKHAQGRIDAQAEIAEHTDKRITRWRAFVDLSVRTPRLLGAGVFVRWVDGQDYYNIGFANRRSRILLGLTLDPSGLESPR